MFDSVDHSGMTLDQIRIFLCVAEHSHVTHAARELNLTQSAVSAAIAALERQHDVRLFDRVGRGIVLTDEGAAFLDTARALMAQADTARLVLEDLAGTPQGHLRIFASQTVAAYWLPSRLMTLNRDFPRVRISLTIGNTSGAAQAVGEGSADIGFVEGDLPPSDLRRLVVAQDELVLVMARDHPMARKPQYTAGDYRALNWLMREPGSGTRTVSEAHLSDMGLTPDDLNVVLEFPSNEAIIAGLQTGQCAAMLSRRALGAARAQGLAIRRVTWAQRPLRPFAVLTHPDRHRTRALEALMEIVRPR